MEDWKVTILSYNVFPTVPLTFDEMYWEAYWPIVNESLLDVRKVMMKLDKGRKENEKNEKQRKLEREEAEPLKVLKKQEELRLRKTKKIVESPTQSPLPSSPHSTPEKMKSPENAKLTPSRSNPTTASYAGNSNAPPVCMITQFVSYVILHNSKKHC